MRQILFLTAFVIPLYSNAQEYQKKIVGTFEKHFHTTYTRITFYETGRFLYEWRADLGGYDLEGDYKINSDTLTLNSGDFVDPGGHVFRLRNEKWLIINKNKIFQNDTIQRNMIYVGYYLERTKKRTGND